MKTTRKLKTAAVAAALAASTFAFSSTQATANGSTFTCDPGFYQVISGQLAELDPASNAYKTIGPDHGNYNAMAYRISDDYLYGISGKTLYRIDATGALTNLATLNVVSGSYTGDFDDEGYLNVSRGGRDWHKINVDTFEEIAVPEFNNYTAVADITNVHGVFYGVSSDGALYSYDQTSLETKEVGMVEGLPETLKSYGAAWATAGGNLYVGRNSGEIYQITGYTTSQPKATQVGSAPATSSNDGASCSLAAPQAGLDDVDGPEPESEPRTQESKDASQNYSDNYDEISQTFTPAETQPQEEPPSQPPADDGETYAFDDAGLGTGPSCGPAEDVDRPLRDANKATVEVAEPTTIFSAGFTGNSLDMFKIVDGSWEAKDGELNQIDDCGFDYAVLLKGYDVSDYRWEATFKSTALHNQGGLLIHQASTKTRSGAMLVDLADEGKTLRWGEYDEKGYYQFIGSVDIDAPATGQAVKLGVEVHGQSVTIMFNGEKVGEATATHTSGMVGLSTSNAVISFTDAELTALPANAPANAPAQKS